MPLLLDLLVADVDIWRKKVWIFIMAARHT